MIVSLVAAVALLVGGLRVLRGGTPGLLLYAACAGVGLWVLAVIVDFAQGYEFSAWGLIGLVIPGGVVALLLLAPSKEYFALDDQVP